MDNINIRNLIDEVLEEDVIFKLLEEGGTLGISHEARHAEALLQYNVLKWLGGDDNTLIVQLIDKYGGIFRKAIKEYRNKGKIPTEKELITFTNKIIGGNIKQEAEKLKNLLLKR